MSLERVTVFESRRTRVASHRGFAMNVPFSVRPMYLLVSGLAVLAMATVSTVVVDAGVSLPDLASMEFSAASALLMSVFGL